MTRTPERRWIINENGAFEPDFARGAPRWWEQVPTVVREAAALVAIIAAALLWLFR